MTYEEYEAHKAKKDRNTMKGEAAHGIATKAPLVIIVIFAMIAILG
jgi:hypothetical protein